MMFNKITKDKQRHISGKFCYCNYSWK